MTSRTSTSRSRALSAGFGVVLTILLASCHTTSSGPAPGSDPGGDPTGTTDSGAADPTPADPGPMVEPAFCTLGEAWCPDHATSRECVDGANGRGWVAHPCAPPAGCFAGRCTMNRCADECNAGTTDGSRTCALVDVTNGTAPPLDPVTLAHDRARAYETWIWRDSIKHGGITNPHYDDAPAYAHQVPWGDIGDSAIWTGTYLAAEALRLKATGSRDARTNVEKLVQTLHFWFSVPGNPGMLARYVAPAGNHPLVIIDCGDINNHCNKLYDGQRYDYSGHVSRDQYQGPMMGYGIAYEALGASGEATRALIRQDVLAVVTTLMTEQTIPVRLTYGGTVLPVFNVHSRYVILSSDEMTNGAVDIVIAAENFAGSNWWGLREFLPDMGEFFRQFPILSWVPTIPRSGTAVMVPSFFQVALLVTEGVPGYESTHAEIQAFYDANIGDWLDIAETWYGTKECDDPYYPNNITMEPMYNLARLETEPTRHERIAHGLLGDSKGPFFAPDKNVFFAYIVAANQELPDNLALANAEAQLLQFPPPPRVMVAIDWRGDSRYPPNPDCPLQAQFEYAVDVGDRWAEDFIWQRQPWRIYAPGDPNWTYPGVDYLVAYWMGRVHGFLADDTPTACLVWQ